MSQRKKYQPSYTQSFYQCTLANFLANQKRITLEIVCGLVMGGRVDWFNQAIKIMTSIK